MAGWHENLREVLDRHRDWYFHQYQPRAGDIVLDIGAGVGEDTIILSAAVGPRGRVLAVEAHPVTFELLAKTCRYNHLDANTTCVHCALMDKAGTVQIESRAAHRGNTIRLAAGAVPACSLDDLCRQQGIARIDFLKMNIEGAERFAIAGMAHMIQHTRAVCIACHDFLGEQNEFYRTKALVVEFLRANGFAVLLREDHPEPWTRNHVYGLR
jgi:FkbM family methyltransferase